MKTGSNFQDNCVAHSFPDADVIIEEDGHVGHGAVLHGCIVGKNAMVGMNSVVMDRAVIGENSIVGAMAFVKAGMAIAANQLVVGMPAKAVRELTEQEKQWKSEGTLIYQRLALEAKHTMKRVAQPLTAPEPNRRRVQGPEYDPLIIAKLKKEAVDKG